MLKHMYLHYQLNNDLNYIDYNIHITYVYKYI